MTVIPYPALLTNMLNSLKFNIFTYLNGYNLLKYYTLNKQLYKSRFKEEIVIHENIQFTINVKNLEEIDYDNIRKNVHLLKNVRIVACNDKIMEIIGPNVRIFDISRSYDLSEKYKSTITDKGFSYFKKIHTLNMAECNQITITDSAFENLLKIVNHNF